jgi:hypothetical protein
MAKVLNRARVSVATTGTGSITLGAAVTGFQTFADAGAVNADTIHYVLQDGDAWEIGIGTYTASGTVLARSVSESTNGDAALNLSGSAECFSAVTNAALGEKENADPDILKRDAAASLAVGFTTPSYNAGTFTTGTFTPNYVNGNVQHFVKNGNMTLASPTSDGNYILTCTNGASAGTITFTGMSGPITGDEISTVNAEKFRILITRANGISDCHVRGLQ